MSYDLYEKEALTKRIQQKKQKCRYCKERATHIAIIRIEGCFGYGGAYDWRSHSIFAVCPKHRNKAYRDYSRDKRISSAGRYYSCSVNMVREKK